MTPSEVWDSTPGEIMDRVNSFARRKKIETKERISAAFCLARIIGENVALKFNGKSKPEDYPKPWDSYPELFEEELKQFEELEKQEQINKARENRRKYAATYNKQKGGVINE